MMTRRKDFRGGDSRPTLRERDEAVRAILELLPQALMDPATRRSVGLQNRFRDEGPVWDLVIRDGADERWVEIKTGRPAAGEVYDFAQRVRSSTSDSLVNVRFELHFGVETTAVRALSRVVRLAREHGGLSTADLSDLSQIELKIVEILGPQRGELLGRIRVTPLQPGAEPTLGPGAAAMLGRAHHPAFVREVREAVERCDPRNSLDLSDLAREVLPGPGQINITLAAGPAYSALALLSAVPDPLPRSVVARVCGLAEPELEAALRPLADRGLVLTTPQTLMARRQQWTMRVTQQAALLATALEALIDFCADRGAARAQVRNLLALGEACLETHPRLVAQVFGVAQHPAKDLGDWSLVLDHAELTHRAVAPLAPRADTETRTYAIALICGRAWVLQRRGELAAARDAIEYAREMCAHLNWPENDAFAAKCIGRIDRRLAEELAAGGGVREDRLRSSERELQEAIRIFTAVGNLGEAGDAYSLLARTYLVWGRFSEADTAARASFERLPRGSDKDYIDAVLVQADLEREKPNPLPGRAGALYREALELATADHPDVSEMRARALRGLARVTRSDAEAVVLERQAAAIYDGLGEFEAAADSKVAAWRRDGTLRTELVDRGLKVVELRHAQEEYEREETRGAAASRRRSDRRTPRRDERDWDNLATKGRQLAAQYRRPWR